MPHKGIPYGTQITNFESGFVGHSKMFLTHPNLLRFVGGGLVDQYPCHAWYDVWCGHHALQYFHQFWYISVFPPVFLIALMGSASPETNFV
jgi:hypothetical protein